METNKLKVYTLIAVLWLYILFIAVCLAALFYGEYFILRVLLISPLVYAGLKASDLIKKTIQ